MRIALAEMKHCFLLFLFNSISAVNCGYNNLPPSYNPNDKEIDCSIRGDLCEIDLVIEALESMTFYQYEGTRRRYQGFRAYFDRTDSEIKIARSKNTNNEQVPNKNNLQQPIITDGHFRAIYTINGQMPGPTIVARENQTLRITVYNELKNNEGLAIHWHGMHQVNTSEMDGVPYISHYPFVPNQHMIYQFKAYPSGTHWYHAHSGAQRTDGIYGALIVKDTLPGFDVYEDYTLILMDWSREPSHEIAQQIVSGSFFWREPIAEECIVYLPTKGPDITTVGPFPFWSGLINDRGRHCDKYDNITNTCTYSLATKYLSHFTVSSDKLYRFRLIGAQSAYAFKFSIQDHLLIIVATDGDFIKPIKEVHYVIVNTGERYDVLVNTSNHEVRDYWIIAETLEIDLETSASQNFYSPISAHKAEAVLHYESTENISVVEPSETWNCDNNTCHIVNCPFSSNSTITETMNYRCTNVHQFENLNEQIPLSIHNPTIQLFYNFDFDGEISTNPSSVDGINFRFPPDPPVTEYKKFKEKSQEYICPGRGCVHRLSPNPVPDVPFCACTQQVDLSGIQRGQAVEMVITNLNIDVPGRLTRGSSHPVHLHGHSFYVVTTGYPSYNDNGGISAFNDDVNCFTINGSPCQTFSTVLTEDHNGMVLNQWIGWRNESLGYIETINRSLPKKDTLIVPYGGYVVIRFVVDNPGWWFMHCHIEIHQLEGMAIVLQELPNELNTKMEETTTECKSKGMVAKSQISIVVVHILLYITLR